MTTRLSHAARNPLRWIGSVCRVPARAIISLSRDTSGGVAIIFSLSIVVLFTVMGLAVDYATLNRTNTQLQAAADAAALGAATAARSYAAVNGLGDVSQIESEARDIAARLFASEAEKAGERVDAAVFDVSLDNGRVSVTATYNGWIETTFSRIAGIDTMEVSGKAIARAGLPPFVEVHLLIDTSGSMAIGASAADQQALTAQTGCAFACHDGVAVNGYADAYAYANASGIKLRIKAINEGILALMDKIDEIDSSNEFVSTAVYSFNNSLTTLASLTTDTSAIRSSLPSDPAISGETDGATHFKELIDQVVTSIGPGGNGKSSSDPKKILIIATDGAQDPGRFWTTVLPARNEVDAFDMSFCGPLKSSGVHVGIIHTPYHPIASDWGYAATLGMPSQRGGPATRADDIAPALQGCAEDRYVMADDYATIKSAFTSILSSLGVSYLAE